MLAIKEITPDWNVEVLVKLARFAPTSSYKLLLTVFSLTISLIHG